MTNRAWTIARALDSCRQLSQNLEELSEDEIIEALKLESATRRRKSVMNKLIAVAANLNRKTYILKLKEKYNGSSN